MNGTPNDSPHDASDGPGDTDHAPEVKEFQREVEYAEAEYPGEDVLTLSPWDKFQLVEQDSAVYFTLPSGTHVRVELVLPEEMPRDDDRWVFEPGDDEPGAY